jgi:RecA/RadA recombinase
MSALLAKLKSATGSVALSESPFFTEVDTIPTGLPTLDIAMSGDIDGGLVPGLTIVAGESKSFKTMLCLYACAAYLNKYPEAVAIAYDNEFSLKPDYLRSMGIDPDRVVHEPIEHIEQLKFKMVKHLEAIKRGDKVFMLVDSIGSIGSKKEIDDAIEEKSVADMTRAKALRSWLRICTAQFTMKNIPCMVVAHTYQTMEMFSKAVVGGGTAPMYFANQLFIVTKAQDTSGTGATKVLNGFTFTINVVKSRFIKEKSKLKFDVSWERGIAKFSGLLDLAMEAGDVINPKKGKYSLLDLTTGEVLIDCVSEAKTETELFLGVVLKRSKFKEFIKNKFKLIAPIDNGEEESIPEDIEDEE